MIAGILTGCTNTDAAVGEPVAVDKGKVAVVYFSWSPDGNTRFAAETVAAKAGAKLFEIKAEKSYNTNYRACCALKRKRICRRFQAWLMRTMTQKPVAVEI